MTTRFLIWPVMLLALTLPTAVPHGRAAGVTIITHGLNSDIDDWVIAMAERIPNYALFPGTTFSCYEIYFTSSNSIYVPTWRRLGGSVPQNSDSAEILIKLDWRQLANNSYSTFQVAASVAPVLTQTGFISEWPGHALAELPLHLIGHSRGGSLICELSKLLGNNGVWVDHLTTLDPHPLNNDGFSDFPYTVVDAPARTYENAMFHDNYFQNLNFIAYGEPVAGAYVRELTNLDGGYEDFTASHSDVHLWYHGTLDLEVPTDDSVATISATERQNWWTPYESLGVVAGFHYSLIGRGDRTSTARPEGTGFPRVRDGYNQKWDLGGGTNANRFALAANNGNWPNVLRFNLLSSNVVAHEQTNIIDFYFQWARSTNAQATISIYTDEDFNPWNGNEHWVRDFVATGTTGADIMHRSPRLILSASNAPPGVHSLFAKTSANGRSRYLYAPELLTVLSSFQPPQLTMMRQSSTNMTVRVRGLAGQRIVLERSSDLAGWNSFATNWLTQPTWDYTEPAAGKNARFFRASVR